MKNRIAIIVGNGKSRSSIELESLVGQGTIFGCNALYRDFDYWDFLIAIDERMEREILTTEKRMVGQVIFPPQDERWEDKRYSPNRRRSNAGMNAMLEAIRRDHNILYCLGFDFLLEGDISVGNVYKGSTNYEPNTQSNQNDIFFRIKYLEWFVNQHRDVHFIFVIPDNAKTTKYGIDADNLKAMKISTFLDKVHYEKTK